MGCAVVGVVRGAFMNNEQKAFMKGVGITLAFVGYFVFWSWPFALAKPDRPDVPKKDAPPSLAWYDGCQTNWGVCTIKGKSVTLTGHSHWTAEGELRKLPDGWRVVLIWTLVESGRRAPGVYEIGEFLEADDTKTPRLIGRWAWGDECEDDGKGGFKGLSMGDWIWRIPPVID
jgi:hypothetical protein